MRKLYIALEVMWIVIAVTLVVALGSFWMGYLALVVGDSMEPNYKSGDLVVIIPQEEYGVGDVVAFGCPIDRVGVVHRIIRLNAIDPWEEDEFFYKTQGDNNEYVDPGLLRFQDIHGKVFRIPLGYLWTPDLEKIRSVVQ